MGGCGAGGAKTEGAGLKTASSPVRHPENRASLRRAVPCRCLWVGAACAEQGDRCGDGPTQAAGTHLSERAQASVEAALPCPSARSTGH